MNSTLTKREHLQMKKVTQKQIEELQEKINGDFNALNSERVSSADREGLYKAYLIDSERLKYLKLFVEAGQELDNMGRAIIQKINATTNITVNFAELRIDEI